MPDIELLALVQALEEFGVRYVVIGGMALLLNGAGVTTRDVDLSIALDKSNLQNLAHALNKLEPRLRNGQPIVLDEKAFGGEFVTFFTRAGVLQIINRLTGIQSFDELEKLSTPMEIHGIVVQVASLQALEKMKESTGREKDIPHLEIIRSLIRKRKT